MAQPTFDILSLPVELQCLSISFLDPATLVSLSQADTYFRRLIQPGRHEIVQRLLQLECTEEHGGGLSQLDFSSWIQFASMRDRCIKSDRWACTGCLRLLPHTSFDNHSLMRLGYRKPAAGSRAADPSTDWGAARKRWGRRFHQPKDDASEQPLQDGDADERWGSKRHLRKCNECRFQNQELGKANSRERGTPAVPIQPSRGLAFASSRDRFFPGLAEHVGLGPLSEVVADGSSRSKQFWPTRMIRCPGCAEWQEMRSFRLGTKNSRWVPIYANEEPDFCAWNWDDTKLTRSVMDGLRCNSCFVDEHGVDALARVLSGWAKKLMRSEVSSAEFALFSGWETVRSNLKHIPLDYQAQFEGILRKHEPSIPGPINPKTLPVYKSAHDELCSAWDQMTAEEGSLSNFGGQGFDQWLHHYHVYEARWELVTKLHAVVVRQPEVLAAWALS
ncbi:unnamed protein product [Clonostachys rosea f. rosea IK726]|jgi:hypothetical protein|uniref:F-box domain-containing protein n=2 Tax=Bionectria ochroleuca TaxID=29856 RepID=A0A8H7N2E9_BIOOC|nr:unnamed protein product [Clonostachys rosea f. rosea IK726]